LPRGCKNGTLFGGGGCEASGTDVVDFKLWAMVREFYEWPMNFFIFVDVVEIRTGDVTLKNQFRREICATTGTENRQWWCLEVYLAPVPGV
jgi:hypothetical protein